jgi:1-acyl-sn-glycerol-3-phosphate acyltransferase
MSILDYIKLFIHYLFTPIRIILCIITYNVFHKIGEYCDTPSALHMFQLLMGKTLMAIFGFNIEISNEDLVKYSQYLYSDKKLIAVFNHTTVIDGFILMATFERFSAVLLKLSAYKWIGYSDLIHEKYKNIWVEKNKTTSDIIDRVSNRKPGQSILFIAPGSGNVSSDPDHITEFKGTGAFAGKFDVLPITMYYEDDSLHHNKDNGESFIHSTLKLFIMHNNYKVKIKVGDLIEYQENESIEEYKQRVYDIMNAQYQAMKV